MNRGQTFSAGSAAVTILAGAGVGLLYAGTLGNRHWAASALYGVAIMIGVWSFERGLVLGGVQRRIRRLPTLLYVPASEATYLLVILIGHAVAGVAVWAGGLSADRLADAVVPSVSGLLYSIAVTATLVFVMRVRDLIGRDVFQSLLIGRYHRPVEEERVFLFLDIVGSTAYARQHGDLQAQAYLAAVFAAIADPVRDHGGAIDDYVGDMALITWPLRRGLRNAACIRCLFAIFDRLDRDGERWRQRFGRVPAFHAALHGGSIVTAEIGVDRHKISYFGDVVNTTARIETLCRQLDAPVLISSDLLRRIAVLPDGLHVRPFGIQAVKERDKPLEVFGLERLAVAGPQRRVRASWGDRTRKLLAGG